MSGALLVAVFFASAIFAPWLTPHSPSKINIPHRFEDPSATFLLGTDQLGRDTLTRVLYGGRVALQVAAIAVSAGLLAGLVLGMLAGYGPRWMDNALLLVFDTINSFPAIMLALAIITLTGPSLHMVIAVIIITSIPSYGRIARTQPRLIIADEPTAGLDVSVQGEILNLMAELQERLGLAYLIITHNLPVVRHVSDRLAIMYLGRIVEQGGSERIFARPAHPYTKALLDGIPQPDPDPDPDRRRKTVSIEGEIPSLEKRPGGCEFHPRCPSASFAKFVLDAEQMEMYHRP